MNRLLIIVCSLFIFAFGYNKLVYASPYIYYLEGKIDEITDPYDLNLASHLSMGQTLNYSILFDLEKDGYFISGFGGVENYYHDQFEPTLKRDWFYAELLGSTYMRGEYPLPIYYSGRNQLIEYDWGDQSDNSYTTDGEFHVGDQTSMANLTVTKFNGNSSVDDVASFVGSWKVGDIVGFTEYAWGYGENPGQPYQISISGKLKLLSIAAPVPEPTTFLLFSTGLAGFFIRKRKV